MTTKLDPVVANKVAENHRSTGGDIKLQMGSFNDAVDLMGGYCSGRMMDAVRNARNTWMGEAQNIISDLNLMADTVERAAGDLSDMDVTNAGELDTVGVGILRDL